MAQRQSEFNERGARIYGLSADSPGQNSAVMEKLALPFAILSDGERDQAIRPLGFEDEGDVRQISRPGVAVISPDGEAVYRYVGRDYADRPDEDVLLADLEKLGLAATEQEKGQIGAIEPGEKAIPGEGLRFYFSGAKFANLALRRRHRDLGDEFQADTKAYIQMIDRYLEALSAVEDRKG
jgi:AhpC/TSA family